MRVDLKPMLGTVLSAWLVHGCAQQGAVGDAAQHAVIDDARSVELCVICSDPRIRSEIEAELAEFLRGQGFRVCTGRQGLVRIELVAELSHLPSADVRAPWLGVSILVVDTADEEGRRDDRVLFHESVVFPAEDLTFGINEIVDKCDLALHHSVDQSVWNALHAGETDLIDDKDSKTRMR